MAESALRVRKAAADVGLHLPVSVKSHILGFGGSNNNSLRQALARMQATFVGDYKYCNPDRLDEFDVHFVVLAPDEDAAGNPIDVPTATNAITDPETNETLSGTDLFKREIEILNQHFVMENRQPVSRDGHTVRFRYKSHHYLEDIQHTDEPLLDYGRPEDYDELISYGDNGSGFYGEEFHRRIWACNDRRFVDPLAINIFIIDKRVPDMTTGTLEDTRESSASTCPHPHQRDRFRPFILLDWVRILHRDQAEEHEMGHVFGLGHVADPRVADFNDPASDPADLHSNIMQGSGSKCRKTDPPSENGWRDVGFGVVYHKAKDCGRPFDQVAAIMEMAWKHQDNWREVYTARWPGS